MNPRLKISALTASKNYCGRSEHLRLKGEMPGQTSTECIRALSVEFLTALYFFRLLVFSHKTFGLGREPLILLDYHQKQ